MASRIWSFCGRQLTRRYRALPACLTLLFALARFACLPAASDGCFVFRWDKKIDINEPTQKAIIVHDGGREDLLLQVKYEGPLEEFGWLIPVPTLPKVEKGSMQAFYELSQLTQRHFGGLDGFASSRGLTKGGAEEPVKVIEIKTVGAYEVAVLSARDGGGLARWLQANNFSVPAGKSGIIEEYIRKGWCFVAAKIRLDEGVAFRMVSNAGRKGVAAPVARKAVQKQLSSGELHPLLISFDTPTCIFPLSISAVGGKPSEVLIYVLSAEPLLDPFTFDKSIEKIDRRRLEWEEARPQRLGSHALSLQNLRILQLSHQLSALDGDGRTPRNSPRDWSIEDLAAIAKEGEPPPSTNTPGEEYYESPGELLHCMRVTPDQISKSAKDLPRLKNRGWYLVKLGWTFTPEEMHDLEFEPAIPAVARILPLRSGAVAAALLSQFGSNAVLTLAAACQSTNPVERINAASGIAQMQDPRLIDLLLKLFQDPAPQVRLHAARASGPNWDRRLVEPLVALFRDPDPEIRGKATECLGIHETAESGSFYVALLTDPIPSVQACALRVLWKIDPDAILQAALRAMLKNPDEDIQSAALEVASRLNREMIQRADLVRLLGSSRIGIVSMVLHLLQRQARGPAVYKPLSSAEATPLTTNALILARLMGLKILRQNADAEAIELTLPLLRDTHSLVRSRAFALLRNVSGQAITENDPAKWEHWWTTNKPAFKTPAPAQ